MTFPPVEEQLAIIRRGVEKIVPEEEQGSRCGSNTELIRRGSTSTWAIPSRCENCVSFKNWVIRR